jgi:DNA-binding transcriptional MerR regulator
MTAYTTKEAAKICGLSEERIRQYCRTFDVLKVGRDFIMYKEDIDKIIARKGLRGVKK